MDSQRTLIGILVILAVSVGFAFGNTLASLSYASGSGPLAVSTTRFVLPAIILIGLLLVSGKSILLPRRDGLIAMGLGFVTVIYSWSILSAIEVLPVSLAILIFFLFPVFTSLIIAILGWERLRPATVIAAVVAFGGLSLALGVSADSLRLSGVVLAAIGALGLAIVSVVSSRVIKAGDSRQVTLYLVTTAAVSFAVISLFKGEFLLPQSSIGWWSFLGSNLLFAGAMIGFFVGISMIGPVKATLFSYIEPLVTIAAAFLILGQSLFPLQILGVVIVVGALVMAGLMSLRNTGPTHTES